ILIQFRQQFVPEALRQDHQGEFTRIAALLADPAPVARGLLARHGALLAQDGANTAPCQKVAGADARDAAADYHDVGFRGKGFALCLASIFRTRERDGGKLAHRRLRSEQREIPEAGAGSRLMPSYPPSSPPNRRASA